MASPLFDLRELYRAIGAERERRGLSWAELGRQVGVAVSTIRRFQDANDAEADGVLALVRWLGVAPEDFVKNGSVDGVRLRNAGEGYIRVDMELVAKAQSEARGAQGRTRTSIQNLVDAGQRSHQPMASLTRFNDV